MNQYEKTYSNYRLLMLRLRDEFDTLMTQVQWGATCKVADNVVSAIDETIVTAEQERNLPSAELCVITEGIADCKERVYGAGSTASSLWKRCFITLKEAADMLMSITDDSYVCRAHDIAARNIQ